MNGYEEAAKIDNQLDKLVKKYPITKDNADEWLILARTVIPSLTLIRQKALGGGKH